MRRLAAVLVSMLAAAAAIAAAPTEPTVDSIVAAHITARGGIDKLRALQTLRQKGHAIAEDGRQALVVRELKRPGKVRFEFTVQGVTGVYVTADGRGWQVAPFSGDMSAQEMPGDAVADAMEQADIEGPLADWKAKGHHVELVGHETVSGRDTYKLKVTLKSGGVLYDFIDVKTHDLLRTEATRLIRGRDVRIMTTFSDQKKTAGIRFPRRVEVSAAGRPQTLRIVVDSVEVNPPIDDARFRGPKAAK